MKRSGERSSQGGGIMSFCSGSERCLCNGCGGTEKLEQHAKATAASYQKDGLAPEDYAIAIAFFFVVFCVGILVGLGLA